MLPSMNPDSSAFIPLNLLSEEKSLTQFNPFVGGECVLKKCCKKYKKGKRCKKCPD